MQCLDRTSATMPRRQCEVTYASQVLTVPLLASAYGPPPDPQDDLVFV